jgi:hypothetical protein
MSERIRIDSEQDWNRFWTKEESILTARRFDFGGIEPTLRPARGMWKVCRQSELESGEPGFGGIVDSRSPAVNGGPNTRMKKAR